MSKSIRYHLIFLFHFLAIFCAFNASFAQCGTDIDLSTWITEGNPANGNWVVSGPNGNTVTQSINGEPTFFVSPDEFINVQINGKFYVDNAAWDDDFIGFVFGYQNPTSPVVNDCDFYIFDWKASTQVVNGQTGNEGFSLGKVDGTFNWNGTGTFYPTFWGRNANNNYTPIATQYGNNEGWNTGVEYEFSLIYTTTTITIIVAGDTIFDEQGCFPPGRFGFYNLSQDYSSYYDFSYQVIADIDASATQSCSNDSIDFVSINNNCLTSGFTAAQITSWQWDFGDGTTSSDTNYRHAYDSAGTYTVTLIVEDDLNCIDTATMDIEVFPLPSNFLGNDTSVCEGNVATFQSLNTYNSYDWSDGSSGNQTTTTTPGNYWLNVVDANMCTGSDTINLSNFPLPQFSIGTNDTICTTDSLTIAPNNTFTSYLWNTAETTQGITINTPGTYQLTVTDSNACSAADTFELFNYPVAVTNLGNDITICPDDSASITPGNNYTSFNWNTNETSSSINVNSIGNYWVETIDLNGCPSSDTLVLDTFVLPYFSLRNDTAICDQYVLAVDGGNNFTNYAWSTSESTQNINVTSAGVYTLTVTDNNNCSQVDSFDLTVFPLPQFSIGTNDTICTTDSLSIASNNSYSSYQWNTAENTQGITINTPGTYQLTVTDSNTCSAADTFELFNYPAAVTNLGNDITICPDDSASITPGNNYTSFNWNTNETSSAISVNSIGNYWVETIDLNGCPSSDTLVLDTFVLPFFSLRNDTAICDQYVLAVDGGNNFTNYAWSTSESTQNINVTSAGVYTLTVTDNNNCSQVDSFDLTVFPLPQFSIGTNDTICTTDSLSIASNNSYSSYLWNTAENTQGITINTPGTYQLTVTDSNACSAADTFQLFNYPAAVTNLGNDITICPDDSASITPGNNYTSFNWNTNETSSSINVNSIGNYWVETIDLNGCPSIDTLVLDTFVLPYFSLRNDTAICDQYVLAVDGGNNFSNYAWSTSESTQNINVTSAGTYALTVTDNNNCSQVDDFDLTVFALPQFSIGTNDTICTTDSLTIASNNSYSSYLWNTAETTQGITINTPGTYQLTVTDSNACSAADTFELFNYPVASTNLGNNVTVCPGDYATISPGNNYQSYNWKNGYSTNSISVNTVGNYWVETIDVNGCPSADTVVVNNFTVPALNLGNDTNICLQSFDTINLDATNSFVQFQWNDGSTSQNYLVTQQGSYAVTTTDQNGCTTSDAIQIGAYPQTTFAVNDDTVCVGNSASLNISGSGLVSYTWSNGGTSSSINTTQTGNYFITVSDTNNCEAYGSSSVRNHPQTTPYIGVDDTLCMRDIKFLDAGAVYTSYQWSTGETTQNVSIDTSGTYWVEVQDTNGCFGRDSINLTFNYGPTLNLGTDTSICSGDSLTLNGGQAISYLWNTGETTQNISVGSAGIYAVTTTDQNTCTSIDSFQLSIYNLPTVDLGSPIYYCEGTTFNQPLDAGSGYSSYSWMNGVSSQVLMLNETMSTVWVEVTDANTCSNSDTMFVIEDPKPYINLGSNDTACSAQITTLNSGNNTGGVTSYLWSTNQTSPSITFQTPINVTNPVTSSYSLTVTDTNACINSDTITLTTLPLPNPDLGPDTAYCYGSSFSTVLNPGQFSAYNWNTGNSSQTINIGAFDSVYSVTVTDANGCQNSDYIIVSEYALPNPDLGNDIYYCEGTNFSTTLDPGNFNEYYWDSGKSLPYHLVTGAGNYHVTVTDVNGCENSDSISIFMSPKPIVDLGNDITMCEDSVFMMTFDASTYLSQNQYNFQWNTGSTNPTVLITDFGTYSVTVTESNSGCMDSSSVSLLPFNLIEVSLGNDTIICDGSRQLIEANVSGGSGYSYLWSTGATTTSINIYEPGEYWVELNSNNNTCGGVRDTINYELAFAPDVELGDDIEACIGEEVYLVNQLASNEYTEYDWDFMGIGDSMLVTYDGFYEVTASNACGTAVDRISVIFMDCFQVYIPNAFTPNGDNLNDIFKPETDQPLEEYEFLVFDRWGNQVFKSTEISLGWDGTYHGEIAADGIYMWKISYVSGYDSKRKFKEEIGQVNLIK